MLNCFLECGVICIRRAIQLAQTQCVRMISLPFLDAAVAHEIAVIFEKFFQARARSVCELNLRFLGSAGSLAALENVLFPRTRSLVICSRVRSNLLKKRLQKCSVAS